MDTYPFRLQREEEAPECHLTKVKGLGYGELSFPYKTSILTFLSMQRLGTQYPFFKKKNTR